MNEKIGKLEYGENHSETILFDEQTANILDTRDFYNFCKEYNLEYILDINEEYIDLSMPIEDFKKLMCCLWDYHRLCTVSLSR